MHLLLMVGGTREKEIVASCRWIQWTGEADVPGMESCVAKHVDGDMDVQAAGEDSDRWGNQECRQRWPGVPTDLSAVGMRSCQTKKPAKQLVAGQMAIGEAMEQREKLIVADLMALPRESLPYAAPIVDELYRGLLDLHLQATVGDPDGAECCHS